MIQNAASLYVYLPRRLSLEELLLSIAVICAALALIFAWGGGPIQSIIRRKINIHDIRSATLIDLVFGMFLFTRALSMSMIPSAPPGYSLAYWPVESWPWGHACIKRRLDKPSSSW